MAELGFWTQAMVFSAAEAGLYLSYRGHDAPFHWTTHFLVGSIVALAVAAGRARRTGQVPRMLTMQVLGWHVVAMFPDLLFQAGVAHQRWMDLFLLHISSHFVPGRNLTWLVVLLVAALLYAAAVRSGRRGGGASRVS